MSEWLSYRAILGLSVSLVLLPVRAQAEFIIEFTDGRQVTISHYVEEGQTIKIYTSQGAIGFRKADVKQIIVVGTHQVTNTPLDMVAARSSSPTHVSTPGPPDKKEADGGSGKTGGADKGQATAAGKVADTERERINEQYQRVAQQSNAVWEKHVQDLNSGASEEVLAENRQRLNELNLERHKLIKDARQASPDGLPAWAQ